MEINTTILIVNALIIAIIVFKKKYSLTDERLNEMIEEVKARK